VRLGAALILIVLVFAGCITTPDPQRGKQTPSTPAPASPAAACVEPTPGPSVPAVGPGQSGVSDQPGAFSYSGQVAARTQKESYAWENGATGAMVMWSGQGSTGTFTLTILDACSAQTYQKDFSGAGQGATSESSSPGAPGTWLITLDFKLFTGQMGLSVTSG
jgi:hypothetical protein